MGVAYDGGQQEAIDCTGDVGHGRAGDADPRLAAPVRPRRRGHGVQSFPQDIIWGAALFASAAALTRGATSTTIQDAPGRGAGSNPAALAGEAELKLRPYRGLSEP